MSRCANENVHKFVDFSSFFPLLCNMDSRIYEGTRIGHLILMSLPLTLYHARVPKFIISRKRERGRRIEEKKRDTEGEKAGAAICTRQLSFFRARFGLVRGANCVSDDAIKSTFDSRQHKSRNDSRCCSHL